MQYGGSSSILRLLLNSVSAQNNSADQRYLDCSSRFFQCGDFRIGYPFWGLGRPSYCGLREFYLNCTSNGIPVIAISNRTYQLLQIDSTFRVLTVVRTNYEQDFCRTIPFNTTVDTNLFNFTTDTEFVYHYYGCRWDLMPRGARLPSGMIACSNGTGSSNNSVALTTDELLRGYQPAVTSWLGSCGGHVRVPANRTAVQLLQSVPTGLMTAIGRGFGVRWSAYNSLCGSCSSSGGECGFNETASSFICYCADQPYLTECQVPLDQPELDRFSRDKGNNKSKGAKFGSNEAPNLQAFNFSDIKEATNNFSSDNLLGSGGYGPVYKGVLPGGEEIAVKRLSKSSTQGLLEFKNEVSLTARLQHVNLVRVVGFCTENEENLLVYEFMPSRSLDLYLFDPVRRLELDWSKRVRIIEGVIQGLLYLQEYSNFTIIHRDLKASNILLDEAMNPKISDFGMAKLFRRDLYEANTSRIVGTYGYIPPEYLKKGIYSMKYDVYSFGVSLLQIISGKKTQRYYGPDESLHFLEYAYESWRSGEGLEFCDSSLGDSSSQCKLMTCMQVALLCIQDDPDDRPTMLEVSSMLRNGAAGMATPKRPAFSVRNETIPATNAKPPQEIYSYNDDDISLIEPR